jgi:hypothetical protein
MANKKEAGTIQSQGERRELPPSARSGEKK